VVRPINTVTGQIRPDELGLVLPHEHVFHDSYELTNNSGLILSDRNVAVAELRDLKGAGCDTLVDQTVHGLHPEPERLRSVAEEVGINIIAGTGFYWEKFHPSWLSDMTTTSIVRLLVSDITEGFAGTDIKANILGEIGTHHRRISPAEERVLRACAIAQRETHVPIATHALFTRVGLDQARILEEAGADLDKVVIGHCDTVPDVEYHVELLEAGVWIAYDAIGQLDKQSDERRADAIMDLVGRGWGHRILLSNDVGKRQALKAYGGNGYVHLIAVFLPLLRERGADEALIDQLTRSNPQELFTFAS